MSSSGLSLRAEHRAFVDRALESQYWATHIADGDEPLHERCFSLTGRQQITAGWVRLRRCRHERMPMSVDEAGHQHSTLTVNYPNVFDSAGIDWGR